MAEIIRTAANAEITENTRKQTFDVATYYHNPNIEMIIDRAEITTHKVDGVQKNNGVPVVYLKQGSAEHCVYLRSFLKSRRDYKDTDIVVQGSFDEFVRKYRSKTIGEMLDAINNLKGRKVKTTLTVYRGINKNGDVQDIFINGYDFVD